MQPESVARDFFRAYEQGDLETTMAFFDEHSVYTDGPRGVYQGVEAIRKALAPMVTVAPTVTRNVRSVTGNETTVIFERTDHVERDGKSIHYDIAVAIEIGGDGKIRRWRDYYDLQSIVTQFLS
jgi:limonene-1,2-epoxide hydrolase